MRKPKRKTEEYLGSLPAEFDRMLASVRTGALVQACREFEAEGPAVTTAELGRMVEAKLRRSNATAELKPELIEKEADSILDLLEVCQWRLRVRQAIWKIRARRYFQLLNPKVSPAEKEAQERIEDARYPLDFHRGLILMGVSGDNRAKREAAFDEFLRDWIVGSARADHRQSQDSNSANGVTEFVPPTEEYISAELEKQKCEGWKDKYMLLMARDAWVRLKTLRIRDKRSRGGKASGTARRKRANGSD